MPDQLRRSMGLRASQNANTIESPLPTRSRSAERSSEEITCSNSNLSDQRSHVSVNLETSSQSSHYERSNSDPFDDAGDELVPAEPSHANSSKAMPTLFRYPCSQTRNQNCWSETPREIFSVRGPDYLSGDKTKIKCQQYLLQARGCDLFLTTDCFQVKETIYNGALGGNLRKKPTFLFRFLFPWGMMIQYYEVPQKLVPFMDMGMSEEEREKLSTEGFTIPEKALATWLSSDDPEYKNDRLKLIAVVPDGPFIVRKLVTGKPALIGKRLKVSYQYVPPEDPSSECLQVCDLDIATGTAIAQKTVNVTRRYLSVLTAVDIGFVIEGKTPAELPEEMMGSTRLHQVDPTHATSI